MASSLTFLPSGRFEFWPPSHVCFSLLFMFFTMSEQIINVVSGEELQSRSDRCVVLTDFLQCQISWWVFYILAAFANVLVSVLKEDCLFVQRSFLRFWKAPLDRITKDISMKTSTGKSLSSFSTSWSAFSTSRQRSPDSLRWFGGQFYSWYP